MFCGLRQRALWVGTLPRPRLAERWPAGADAIVAGQPGLAADTSQLAFPCLVPLCIRLEALEQAVTEKGSGDLMRQYLGLVAIVVRDYDEASEFYTQTLGFDLIEDTFLPDENRRWVVVSPRGSESRLLLARAADAEQLAHVGNQTGGRVTFFLYTDDFWRDYKAYRDQGVNFIRDPKVEKYGTVAVFRDLYGNLWDLLEPAAAAASS